MSETEYTLGAQCGVTFAGIKPASLVSVKKENMRAIGYYAARFRRKGFFFRLLKEQNGRSLLYIYHRERLQKLLADKEIADFLKERQYVYTTADDAVEQLKSKMAGEEFPHEIGVFLGYALEDVRAFIAHPREGVLFTGCWKVYAHAEEKKKLFRRYKKCSECILKRLSGGQSLESIFKAE